MNHSEVEIYGQSYKIRSELEEAQIKALAEYVNNKMQEIKSITGVISTSKVAILAALNIAEELFNLSRQKENMESTVAEKSSKLLSLIEEFTVKESNI